MEQPTVPSVAVGVMGVSPPPPLAPGFVPAAPPLPPVATTPPVPAAPENPPEPVAPAVPVAPPVPDPPAGIPPDSIVDSDGASAIVAASAPSRAPPSAGDAGRPGTKFGSYVEPFDTWITVTRIRVG